MCPKHPLPTSLPANTCEPYGAPRPATLASRWRAGDPPGILEQQGKNSLKIGRLFFEADFRNSGKTEEQLVGVVDGASPGLLRGMYMAISFWLSVNDLRTPSVLSFTMASDIDDFIVEAE
jgi:hypothetical protein